MIGKTMNDKNITALTYGITEQEDGRKTCRFIQVGEEIDGKFTGMIRDYHGGGCSDFEFWINGESINNEEEGDADFFDAEVHNAQSINEKFDDFFDWQEDEDSYHIIKDEEKNFKKIGNYLKLDDGIDLEPISSDRGLTSFR